MCQKTIINECLPAGKKTSTRCLKCLTKTSKTSCQDIFQMSKRCLKRKSERHLRKTSWRYLWKIYCRCLTADVLKMSILKMHWSYLKMSHRSLILDDLQMPYQKMSCRCLIEDDLQMSYQKMSCMRCLKDVLYNLTMFYIIYL